MHDEDARRIRRDDHAAAADMAGKELLTTKRSGRALEEVEDEFEALEGSAVRGASNSRAIAETEKESSINEKASRGNGRLEINRATSYSPTHLRVQYHRG
jgi:hypothetical protein